MRAMMVGCFLALALSGCSPSAEAPSPPPPQFERTSLDLVEHGRRVSAVLGCTGCHGADLTGQDWSEPGFGTLWTSNLTRAVAGYTDAELEAAIRDGVRPDGSALWGMPSFTFAGLSGEDMEAVIAFLRAAPPTGDARPRPVFEAGARAEIASGAFKSAPVEVGEARAGAPDLGPDFALGRHIAQATCAECHGMDLRGGTPYPGAAERPDLRMVTAYDLPQFERLMRAGEPIGGRKLGLMGEVARGRYAGFTDAELRALHAYLQELGSRAE